MNRYLRNHSLINFNLYGFKSFGYKMLTNMTHSEQVLSDNVSPAIAFDMLDPFASIPQSEDPAALTNYFEAGLGSITSQTNSSLIGPQEKTLVEQFTRNRAISDYWHYTLIILYASLILVGAVGNFLVVIAVARKAIMRTARNLFILNLAFSDLLLCLITMPLTLVEILSKYWQFGKFEFLCKLVAMLQAVSIFVSTISITAIAFDRYQLIVYPTRESLQIGGVINILVCIWLLAVLLASPLFIFKRIEQADIPPLLQTLGIHEVCFCVEDWPVSNGRFYYSIFSLCVQYLLPILIVSAAYLGIYKQLKSRTVVTMQTPRQSERGRRMHRTNCLLITIALIFGISWMPLNAYNLYADMRSPEALTQRMIVMYAFCHMLGMSSAVTNPVLYGFLNDNFRKEFIEIIYCHYKNDTNRALNGHSTGSGHSRRKCKQADISKGYLKLLPSSNENGLTTESVALTEYRGCATALTVLK
ncbi:neuropeptide F receptor [Eurosta solidaginis]|uniref:neuropeptide F receptor n=1 Tax=Eurosta solidaginis TaxID=178769 RepID=UPI0035306D0D